MSLLRLDVIKQHEHKPFIFQCSVYDDTFSGTALMITNVTTELPWMADGQLLFIANQSINQSINLLVLQCSVCADNFTGTPVDGHHCYRQMTVDSNYCFDVAPDSNCSTDPLPLLAGRTVFFHVQPKYLNVDIRIILDVTSGGRIIAECVTCWVDCVETC